MEWLIEKLFNKTYQDILWRGFEQGIDEAHIRLAEGNRVEFEHDGVIYFIKATRPRKLDKHWRRVI